MDNENKKKKENKERKERSAKTQLKELYNGVLKQMDPSNPLPQLALTELFTSVPVTNFFMLLILMVLKNGK